MVATYLPIERCGYLNNRKKSFIFTVNNNFKKSIVIINNTKTKEKCGYVLYFNYK